MISKHLKNAVADARAIYYIAGPPAMVGALNDMLARSGINNDDIRTEKFAGY
jgi:ferredoxin-NADP reductase